MAKKRALGRGLGDLLGDMKEDKVSGVNNIEMGDIIANPNQPRTEFDEVALNELAASISSIGIVQPITVRSVKGGKFEIIAGERRYRASKIAGLDSIPAYIRSAEDDNILELGLIENIQREDLNAIEIAISYRRLIEECKLTQDALSDRIGKSRANVTNYLRLLKLPANIQLGIRDKQISMGHARALINVEDEEIQFMIFDQIIKENLSVRQVEDIVRGYSAGKKVERIDKNQPQKDNYYDNLEAILSSKLNSKVSFKVGSKGRGKIMIPFGSNDDFERIIGLFDKLN